MAGLLCHCRLSGCCRIASDYIDMLTVLRSFSLKLDGAVLFRKQGVITSNTDIQTSMKMGAALPHDDVAGNYLLATINLDAQSFTFRIATVLCTAACFFMSHCNIPFVSWSRPPFEQ